MERYALHKLAMGGVVVLVLLLMVLLLVPSITAGTVDYVGVSDYPTESCYFAISPNEGEEHKADVFLVEKPGAPYGEDVVVLLKCQADYSDTVDPPATIYFGSSEGQCKIFGDGELIASTSWWSQTESSSGKVTLTCQFKSNNGNN